MAVPVLFSLGEGGTSIEALTPFPLMKETRTKRSPAHYLALYGNLSTGVVYAAIGVIAILSFLKLKEGGADESNLVAYLNDYLLGRIAVWFILLGMVSYIIWRVYEVVTDPYGYGKGAKGLATRTGIALSTIADALIAFTAVQALFGIGVQEESGPPREERRMVGSVLAESWGEEAIIGLGVIILTTAAVQLLYGITQGYKERLDIYPLSPGVKKLFHVLAWAGYGARAVILGIIGFFFIKAGATGNAQHVVNTDKAFDFIGDHVGHLPFLLVAAGTIAYGAFMIVLGLYFDSDKD
ncbi:MAG TPA: DUF1206 domain-containing protein [Chitinophagaceae bacterium]